jgi:hypothetical protein
MKVIKVIGIKPEQLKEAGIPFKPRTLYNWHCTGKHPELFIKLNRTLCINLEAWNRWVEQAKQETNRKIERIQK